MTVAETLALRKKKAVLEYASLCGTDARPNRYFQVPRSTFCRWKKAYAEEDDAGLIRKKSVARSHPRPVPLDVVEKILYLRQTYHLGPDRLFQFPILLFKKDVES